MVSFCKHVMDHTPKTVCKRLSERVDFKVPAHLLALFTEPFIPTFGYPHTHLSALSE